MISRSPYCGIKIKYSVSYHVVRLTRTSAYVYVNIELGKLVNTIFVLKTLVLVLLLLYYVFKVVPTVYLRKRETIFITL